MKIGVVGLGKLGLPVSVALARYHDVMGYDIRPDAKSSNLVEEGFAGDFATDLKESSLRVGSLKEVVDHSEVLFVAVQTPHEPRFEGTTALPPVRVDFDYRHLCQAIRDIAAIADKDTAIAVISTVLPGTMRREIKPLLNKHMKLVYNPFFIAMGAVIQDFMHPEFILIGADDPWASEMLSCVYGEFLNAPQRVMSVESAELTKVSYNTFISMKLGFVNTLLEIAEKSEGVNIDDVTDALCSATTRLLSPKYMKAGMGDGGGCHPRDNIAMSWLARKLNLGFDFFEAMMLAREHQAEWLVDLMDEHNLPKCVLGTAFKKGTNITTGSHALLVKHFIGECKTYDPYVNGSTMPSEPHVFLIGMEHDEFAGYTFPEGSVVIDPWRYIPDSTTYTVIRLGE